MVARELSRKKLHSPAAVLQRQEAIQTLPRDPFGLILEQLGIHELLRLRQTSSAMRSRIDRHCRERGLVHRRLQEVRRLIDQLEGDEIFWRELENQDEGGRALFHDLVPDLNRLPENLHEARRQLASWQRYADLLAAEEISDGIPGPPFHLS